MDKEKVTEELVRQNGNQAAAVMADYAAQGGGLKPTFVDITKYPTLQDFLASEGKDGNIYLYPNGKTGAESRYYEYMWIADEQRYELIDSLDMDYGNLAKKPSINGIELSGNKTSNELGVYSKPSGGIPESDLSSDVQQALQKHFKGWLTSTSQLPDNPVVGDYAYVEDSGTTYIYRCTTDGEWPSTSTEEKDPADVTFASSEEVNETYIDDTHLENPASGALSLAEDSMPFKEKLQGITAAETKVVLTENTNWYDNKYIANDATISSDTAPSGGVANGVFITALNGAKRVRFLGVVRGSSDTVMFYGFAKSAIDPTSSDKQFDDLTVFDRSTNSSAVKEEYIIDVPTGMNYFACTIVKKGTPSDAAMTISDFYCYLQMGDTVNDIFIEDDVDIPYIIDITNTNTVSDFPRSINSSGKWANVVDGVTWRVIPVNPGDIIHIDFARELYSAVLRSFNYTGTPTTGDAVDFSTASGFTSRFPVSDKPDFTVPADGHYFTWGLASRSTASSPIYYGYIKIGKVLHRTKGVYPSLDDLAGNSVFSTGEQVKNVKLINDLNTGGVHDALTAEQGKVINGQINGFQSTSLTFESASGSGHPPTQDGSWSLTGYYRRYTVDLTGLYAQGYLKVRFYGVCGSNNTRTAGLIGNAVDSDTHEITVESYVPYAKYTSGWYELPITANSVVLIGGLLTNGGKTHEGSNFDDPNFVPTYIELIGTDKSVMVQLNDLDQRVSILENEVAPSEKFPPRFLPRKTYAVIGDTLQLFTRGVVLAVNPYQYYNQYVCGQGRVYPRYFQITPTLVSGSVPTNLTIKHRAYDDFYNYSAQLTSQLSVAAKPVTSPQSAVNVLCIGASTTAGGQWVAELKRRLTGTQGEGTPAADGLSNINFVGRKTANNVNFEASGGWTWKNFYTQRVALRMQVTDVLNPVSNGDLYQYKDTNNTWHDIEVTEVNVTETSGNILFVFLSGQTPSSSLYPSESGTIRKKSNTSVTITYSSCDVESYAPFYDSEADNHCGFTDYVDEYCNGSLDVAIFFLGSVNAGVLGKDDQTHINSALASMKVMLDSLHRDYPNCRVIIGTVCGLSTHSGMEYTFGAASSYNTWSGLYGEFEYTQAVEDFLFKEEYTEGHTYSEWCAFANTLGEVDSEYCFPTAEKDVNTRMPNVKELYGTNGQHPTNDGYMMVADCMYRCFVNTILN